tara:strand:+ start:5271 stop:5738 length:468 start_codon:yes stop_codon:yes gene_type:complete
MDLTTGQRTFCLGLSGLGGSNGLTEAIDVPFVDSAGNVIRCNYVKVAAGSYGGNGRAAVLVELSGVSHIGDAVTNSLSALSATPAPSGVCGFALLGGYLQSPDRDEWHGSNGEVATGVRLITTCTVASTVNAVITYGNLFPLNTLRLAQGYDKGV